VNRPTPAQGSTQPASIFNLGQPSFNQSPSNNRFPEPQFGGFRPVKKRHSNPETPTDRTGKHHHHHVAAKHNTRGGRPLRAPAASKPPRHSFRPAQSRKEFSVYGAQKRLDYEDYSDYYDETENNVEDSDYYYYYEYY